MNHIQKRNDKGRFLLPGVQVRQEIRVIVRGVENIDGVAADKGNVAPSVDTVQ